MSTWGEFTDAAPAFADKVRAVLDGHQQKTLATLRADGSPRLSGIEVEVADGELSFGSMPAARKGADLRRDPRCALHSTPGEALGDSPTAPGDVKIAGRAVLTAGLTGATPGDGFRVDLTEVVWIGLNDAADRLVVQWWTPGEGIRRIERE